MSAKALLHLSSQAAVNRALARLARNGALLRVARGIYVLPVHSRFGTRAPDVATLHPGQAAGDAIRALAWLGPAGSRATMSHLKGKLSAAELHAIWTACVHLPTRLATVVDMLAAPGYEADDGPLTAAQAGQIRKRGAQRNR